MVELTQLGLETIPCWIKETAGPKWKFILLICKICWAFRLSDEKWSSLLSFSSSECPITNSEPCFRVAKWLIQTLQLQGGHFQIRKGKSLQTQVCQPCQEKKREDMLDLGLFLLLENSDKAPNVRTYILANGLGWWEDWKAIFNPKQILQFLRWPSTGSWSPGTEGILALATGTYMGIWLWQLAHTGNLVATASYWKTLNFITGNASCFHGWDHTTEAWYNSLWK